MINVSSSIRKMTLTVSMMVTLFTCAAGNASQVKDADADSGNSVSNPDKVSVMNKMTPKEQIAYSKQDLATRLGLSADRINVSGAKAVTWRSGALGCPKPGMSYTDVLVPGVWIILRVDNSIYRYHAIPGGQPFYCPEEWAEGPVVGPGAD